MSCFDGHSSQDIRAVNTYMVCFQEELDATDNYVEGAVSSMTVERAAPGTAIQLGQRLRRARLARNMTQSEVAQKQFSVSYISAVERGQIRPSLGALERLAERLEVPLADLV